MSYFCCIWLGQSLHYHVIGSVKWHYLHITFLTCHLTAHCVLEQVFIIWVRRYSVSGSCLTVLPFCFACVGAYKWTHVMPNRNVAEHAGEFVRANGVADTKQVIVKCYTDRCQPRNYFIACFVEDWMYFKDQ